MRFTVQPSLRRTTCQAPVAEAQPRARQVAQPLAEIGIVGTTAAVPDHRPVCTIREHARRSFISCACTRTRARTEALRAATLELAAALDLSRAGDAEAAALAG